MSREGICSLYSLLLGWTRAGQSYFTKMRCVTLLRSPSISPNAIYALQNPHHAELGWILNCITPMGKLRRMTTWKVSELLPFYCV